MSDSRALEREIERHNNFDAIRIVAALTVVIGHAWPLTGLENPPEVAGIRIYHLAVYVFFAISGYLITTSWLRSPRVGRFLASRVLRIFPALVVLVLVTVFVIGALLTTSGSYFAQPQTWGYLQNVTLLAVYDLPGVFEANPIPVVNGSLWTLGPEFVCYLLVLVAGLVAGRFPRARAIVLTTLFAAVTIVAPDPLGYTAEAMTFFGVGSIIATVGARLPLWPALPALAAWLVIGGLVPDISMQLAWLAVPYAVIALGQRSTPVLRRFGRFGDVSYGTYLWGFLVQQTVTAVWGVQPLWLDLLIVVPTTFAIAWVSWHLVEKRALALKPGRQRADDGNRTRAISLGS